ncbi:MAG: hypothetical protein WBR26_26775 [Candidatus Acidiferrum sp.]
MATSSATPRSFAANEGTLGALWVIYGIIRIVVAIFLILYSGVATVMFGALLSRVGNPFFWMGLFHLFYDAAIIVAIVAGVLGLLAGFALLGRKSSARSLSLLAAFFSVSDLPLGTTLGIYTMVVFFR